MSARDFAAWAEPNLVLTLGERTYRVRPPSVADGGKLLALAVRGEVAVGISPGPILAEVQDVLDGIGPDEHPALGPEVYAQLVADGASDVTISRMAYYAIFYWTRGPEYADWIAAALFTPRDVEGVLAEAEADPKE
jgi:hypothetical protein